MTNSEFLKELINNTIQHLEQVIHDGVKNEISFEINCAEIDDFNSIDIRQSDKFKPVYDQLKNASGPSLYWFEITSDSDSKDVIEALRKYKTSASSKATPALKNQINYASKMLYVGKVKKEFAGRLTQHMGFYKEKRTQGLQLFHWAKDLSLNLRIHVIEFDNNMSEIMPIIENAFAKRLQPLIGKHK